MSNRKGYDLVDEKFGLLIVVEDTGERHPKRGKVWLCRCECGEYTRAETSRLKSGNKRSCGCLAKSNAKKKNKPAKKILS